MKLLPLITKITILVILLAGAKMAFAQTDSLKAPSKKSYFKFSAGYLSNAVYNGRQDSVKTPYLTTALGYYHKSGFSLSGDLSYQPVTGMVDVISLDAGYAVDLSDKFNLSFDANKPFYSSSSTAVASGIKASAGTDISYDSGFITIDAGANVAFSDKADVLANGSISHQFMFKGFSKGTNWHFEPTFTVNWGTQNFYLAYQARAAKKKNLSVTSSTVTGNNNFEVLDYEVSIPIGYDAKHWGFELLPVYALPVNTITTTTTNTIVILNRSHTTTSTSTASLQNVFYGQITVYVKF